MLNREQASHYLMQIDRFAAWVLFIVVLLYFISGYGLTKGLMDSSLAAKIHLSWLPIAGLIAFTIHSSWAIHLFLKRNHIWNRVSKILLSAVYIFLVSAFTYVEFFR